MISTLRNFYRKHIRWPFLDRRIYAVLDFFTAIYCLFNRFSFPKNYIRRWKLDMLRGHYEKETASLFKKITEPGMVVVDVGAHVGYFTRIFSSLVGSRGLVLAFEADAENFGLLEKNTRHLGNVIRRPLAVSDRAGTIDFYHCPEKAGCHSTLPNVPVNYAMQKTSVEATSLDQWLAERNIKTVDVIKMDVEGGEYAALKGMRDTLARQTRVALITEFAPDWVRASGISPQDFLRTLASFGFQIFAILGDRMEMIDPENAASYERLIPTNDRSDSYNKFINLYCVKGALRDKALHLGI